MTAVTESDAVTQPDRRGEPRLLSAASWAVLAASFGLSASTWIALAGLAGFTDTVGEFRLAWLMPVAVDGYVVVALVVWMSPVPARVARFARANTYAAASIGVVAQSAFHALTIWDQTGTPWRAWMAAAVGALPPAGAALSVHMRALLRRESRPADMPPPVVVVEHTDPAPVPEPEPEVSTPEPAPQSVNGHDPAKARRVEALANLAGGGDPKSIAAGAGVSVQTVQRWADDAARAARLPRGGPRKVTAGPAADTTDLEEK